MALQIQILKRILQKPKSTSILPLFSSSSPADLPPQPQLPLLLPNSKTQENCSSKLTDLTAIHLYQILYFTFHLTNHHHHHHLKPTFATTILGTIALLPGRRCCTREWQRWHRVSISFGMEVAKLEGRRSGGDGGGGVEFRFPLE